MSRWYRIFGSTADVPEPAGLERSLAGLGCPVRTHLDADAKGWYRAELTAGPGVVFVVERWLPDEEGIRNELNSWAALLEPGGHVGLMERVIQARQLFTLREPTEHPGEGLALCRYLAETTHGFYQADSEGFFGADGALLAREGA